MVEFTLQLLGLHLYSVAQPLGLSIVLGRRDWAKFYLMDRQLWSSSRKYMMNFLLTSDIDGFRWVFSYGDAQDMEAAMTINNLYPPSLKS